MNRTCLEKDLQGSVILHHAENQSKLVKLGGSGIRVALSPECEHVLKLAELRTKIDTPETTNTTDNTNPTTTTTAVRANEDQGNDQSQNAIPTDTVENESSSANHDQAIEAELVDGFAASFQTYDWDTNSIQFALSQVSGEHFQNHVGNQLKSRSYDDTAAIHRKNHQ